MKTKTKTKTWESARRTARRILPVAAFAVLGAAFLPQAGASAATTDVETWGPVRSTWTWEHPATYRTLNSITDNPVYGDERNFVRVRKAGTDDKFGDNVTAEAGATYEVQVYFHNNASSNLNASGKGIMQNVRLAMEVPEVISDGQAAMIKGTLSGSTDYEPSSVWDTAFIHAPKDRTVYLRYVPNSATIYSGIEGNKGALDGQKLDSESLFGAGAKLGFDSWGILPGCSEYAGYVIFEIKVDQPGFYMNKTAKLEGQTKYDQYVKAIPGDVIDFKIYYQNTGTTLQTNVMAFDNLPEGMTLVSGSTFLETPSSKGFEKDSLFSGGLIIGDYTSGQEASITYKVKIDDNKDLFPCNKDVVLYNNSAVATGNGTIRDKVQVTVHRTCDIPKAGVTDTSGKIVLGMIVTVVLWIGVTYYAMASKELKELKAEAENSEE